MTGRFSSPVHPGDELTIRIGTDGGEAVFQTARAENEVVIDAGRFTFTPPS
jgi:hypothetical protein